MTDNNEHPDSRKPTLRAGARRDNFGAAPRKPARGSAPLARFVKREPSAYELEVRQAASVAMQKLEQAAARPEPEPQAPRYGRDRNEGGARYEGRGEPRRDGRGNERSDARGDARFAPRRDAGYDDRGASRGWEERPRYDQPRNDRPRNDRPRDSYARDDRSRDSHAAPARAQPMGDSPAARALSLLSNAAPSFEPARERREYRDDRDQWARQDDRGTRGDRDGRYERNDRNAGGYDRPRYEPRNESRYETRYEPRDGRALGGAQREQAPRFEDRPRGEARGSYRDAAPRRDTAPTRDSYGAQSARHDSNAPHKPAHMGPKTDAEKAGGIRLNKRLAELGMCSRREGDAWIEKGWVTVNGEEAQMGQTVFETDTIEVAQAAQAEQAQQVTMLLHKPMGYVSGLPEDGHESAATLIGPQSQWVQDPVRTRFQARFTRGLAPAGRLDIDSTGLIVFTQNGLVARQLIGENSDVEKEYLVRVHWLGDNPTADSEVVETDVESVFPSERLALLREGLFLDGQALLPAEVTWQNPEQLRFVLKEGKKRQIRRMCEQVGLKVVGLKRIRIGSVVLGNLPVGQWRFLGPNERFGV
jgi:23S rRNA pseudouridine2604 synthase